MVTTHQYFITSYRDNDDGGNDCKDESDGGGDDRDNEYG